MKLILFFMTLSLIAFAHEGHVHNPKLEQAIHGGVVQAGKEINLEVLVNGSAVSIFPLTHEGKNIVAADVKIEAMAKPQKEKPYPVKFTNNDEIKAIVALKGAHRLELEIFVTYKNVKDRFVVQVEE